MTAILEVRGLSAGYGSQPVVHDIDLDVDVGTITVLLGPNGAGKTTIMRTLGGVIPCLNGTVLFEGRQLRGAPHRRARLKIAYVAEERSVFARLTVEDNLRLAGDMAGAIEIFPELATLLARKGGDLSGGEQQMLTLARALSTRPRLLLVDEVSLGLAPLIVDRLLRVVRAAADEGLAVLMVEQHAHKAMRIGDRVAVLSRGKIELNGTASEMRGRMNEIERSYMSSRESA